MLPKMSDERRRRLVRLSVGFVIIQTCIFNILERRLKEHKRAAYRDDDSEAAALMAWDWACDCGWPDAHGSRPGHIKRSPADERAGHELTSEATVAAAAAASASAPPGACESNGERRKQPQHNNNNNNNNNNNQKHQLLTATRNLKRVKRPSQIYYKFFFFYYLFQLARYIVIELLSWDPLRDYQQLDCYILGRFRFVGRTNKISALIAILLLVIVGFYREYLFRFVPAFKFHAIEFLLHDYRDVIMAEIQFESWQRRRAAASGASPLSSQHHGSGSHSDTETSPSPSGASDHQSSARQINRIFFFRSPFNMFRAAPLARHQQLAVEAARREWILRPNRTSKCWHRFVFYTELIFYLSLGSYIIWIALISFTIGGSILTGLGFELSYPACVAWLQRTQHRQRHHGQVAWAIYEAPLVSAHQKAIEQIPAIISLAGLQIQPLTLYYCARVAADALENGFWYTEFMMLVISLSYLVFIMSLDVALNAAEIKLRLGAIVHKLSQLHGARQVTGDFISLLHELGPADAQKPSSARLSSSWAHDAELHAWRRHELAAGAVWPDEARVEGEEPTLMGQTEREQLADEIESVQAILADHFDMVAGYNRFMSYGIALIFGSLTMYSVLLGAWVGSIKSRALEFELLTTETGATFFVLLFFAGIAIARSLNYRLYALIVRAMALDDDRSVSKMRWTTITRFYSPKAMYCFTLFGSTEISWLFCLKFVWWIVSIYIVLTNFYYMNK